MKMVTIRMEDFLYDFYEKVGRQANLPPEQVMADALFKLAGELSLHALHDAKFPRRGRCGHRPLQNGGLLFCGGVRAPRPTEFYRCYA